MKELIAQMKEAMKMTYCLRTGWDFNNLSTTQKMILNIYSNLLFEYDGNEIKALDTLSHRIESLLLNSK
jgi:hypothetical protein